MRLKAFEVETTGLNGEVSASPSSGIGSLSGPFFSSGVPVGDFLGLLSGLTHQEWQGIFNIAPNKSLLGNDSVWRLVSEERRNTTRRLESKSIGPDILGQADIYGVVFHPAVFEFLAASRASSLYGMTFNTFKVLILCYIVTAREGGDKYLSVVDISKSGLIATQTCRDQFHTLENMGMVSKVRYLDVHACRGNLAKRRINYYMLTMEGKEIIREFYKAYVKKLGQFQDMFGKLETSFKFK